MTRDPVSGLTVDELQAMMDRLRPQLVRRGLIEKTPIATAALRGAGDAITFGFGDELQGEAAAFGHSGEDARIRRRIATERARRALREAQSDRPVSTFAGGAATMLIPGAGLARVGRAASGALRIGRELQAARGAEDAVRVAQLAPRLAGAERAALYGSAATHGAIYGAGSGEDVGSRLLGAGTGAVLGTFGAGLGEAAGGGLAILGRSGLDPRVRAERLLARRLGESQPTEQDLIRRFVRQGAKPAQARSQARGLVEAGKSGSFTAEDMINRARFAHPRANSPLMVEMIPQAARDARAIVAVDGPGAGMIDNTLTAQREGFGRDVARQAERTFRPKGGGPRQGRRVGAGRGIENQPPPTGLQELSERLATTSQAANRDAYSRAYRSTQFGMQPEHAVSAARRMTGTAFKDRARLAAIDRADEDIVRLTDDIDAALSSAGLPADEAGQWLARMSQPVAHDGDALLVDLRRRLGNNIAEPEHNRLMELAWDLQDTTRARAALDGLGGANADPNLLNARALDLYQRGLRHLSDAAGGGATEGGRNIAAVRRTFMQNLRSISPDLHEAVVGARGFKAQQEARELGRRIFNPGREGEIDELLRRPMSVEEQDAFMVGALDTIEARLGANDLGFVRQLQRNNNWRAMVMRSARSQQAGRRLLDLIDDKVTQADRSNFIRGGSQTTPIAQDIRRLTQDESELGFIQDVIQSGGDVKNPLLRGAANLYERAARPGIRNPQVQAEMARMLMQPGTMQNAQTLAARLAAAPKASVFTPQGQALARRGGVAGSGAALELMGQNVEGAAEFTGVRDFANAGAALEQGNIPAALGSVALGGLVALPATHGLGPLAKTALAGLGAGAVGVGVANAQTNDRNRSQALDEARSEVQRLSAAAELFSSVDPNDPASVRRAQQALQARGLYVADDGRLGRETAAAIREHREQVNTELERARTRLTELETQERSRSIRAGPLRETARELGPLALAALGYYIGHRTRVGGVRNATSKLAERNRIADALIPPPNTPLPNLRSAAGRQAVLDRTSRLNSFWRQGGAGARTPFIEAPNGFRRNARAANPAELFPRENSFVRGNDLSVLGAIGGEVGASTVGVIYAQREVDEAQAVADENPSEANLVRLERARDVLALAQAAQRAGLGFVGGRVTGAAFHRYPNSPPSMVGAAESERALLNQHWSRRLPRKKKR